MGHTHQLQNIIYFFFSLFSCQSWHPFILRLYSDSTCPKPSAKTTGFSCAVTRTLGQERHPQQGIKKVEHFLNGNSINFKTIYPKQTRILPQFLLYILSLHGITSANYKKFFYHISMSINTLYFKEFQYFKKSLIYHYIYF